MKHILKVAECHESKHPNYPEISRHYFTVRAKDLPAGIPFGANAREPNNINRAVYKGVRESLLGRDSAVDGTFDLMNRGIICLASNVQRIGKGMYEIDCAEDEGIADGGHTYKIICDAQCEADFPDEQYVEVQVRTGVCRSLRTDISRGLNTGIQVAAHSIANLDGKFEWLKEELRSADYFESIKWKESDRRPIDVQHIICALEALNVLDYPNDSGRHPVHSYEKISEATNRFTVDFNNHRDDIEASTYHRLRPILRGALVLHDYIRRDFRDIYNAAELGKAGALDVIKKKKKGQYSFPCAALPDSTHVLARGASFPILAAFRNKVRINPKSRQAEWSNGFNSVLDLWQSAGAELARQTKDAVLIYGRKPDQIGKARGHWKTLHQALELHMLRPKDNRHG